MTAHGVWSFGRDLFGTLNARPGHVRPDELLTRHGEGAPSGDEVRELDRMLDLADQLTILKTRARYTLSQLKVGTLAP